MRSIRMVTRLVTIGMFVAVLVVSLLAACGSSTIDAAPFAAIPDDSVGVTGQATCRFSDDGGDPEGGSGFLVTCELDMSDPRVSGTETHDRFRFYDLGEDSGAWVAEEAVITNPEGTWRGRAQAADDGTPCGEAHYVGEGSYEGLEFHYYFSHVDLDDNAELRGWISGKG